MSGIIININPVIFHWGNIELGWYGLMVITAFLVAVWLSAVRAEKKGIPRNEIYGLAPWVLIAGVIGARIFHVIDQWDYYSDNLLQVIMIQQGGLAIWGALIGGSVAAISYARIKQIPLLRLLDAMVPALLAAQIIGRIGCVINGDDASSLTSLPWAFTYINPNSLVPASNFGLPTHPYPVYEQLWNGASLLFLMLWLRRYLHKDGLLFASYMALYAVGRFILTFVRQEKIWFWGLQEAQVISIFILIAAIIIIIYLQIGPPREEGSEVLCS